MTGQAYDPDRHDTQLVAAFDGRQGAERARDALLGAGLQGHSIEVVADEEPSHGEGFWHSVRRLFAPDADAHELNEALRSGRVMVVVHPQTVSEREHAIEILEGCGPIDLEERDGSRRPELNHAALSRADLIASAPPKTETPAPELPTGDMERATGTTYTYGVPADVAQAMSAEQQVIAQAPSTLSGPQSVRIVEERLRPGWRDWSGRPTRVRSYIAERDTKGQRVELREEEIGAPTNHPAS